MDPKTEVKEEVKQEETDEKGVPLSNRIKEVERKLQEKYDREMAELRRELQEKTRQEIVGDSEEDVTRADLMEFVKNPRGFLKNAVHMTRVEEELVQVKPWLQSQKGYTTEDDAKLMAIERDYALAHPSPLKRAEKAWDILQKEKALSKLNSQTDDEKREDAVTRNSTEGTGKATSKEKQVTRNDIIRKLADAESKGDLDASIRYTNMLEDFRT